MPPRNTRRYFEELDKQLKGRSPQSPEFEALLKSKIGGQFQELVTPENLEKMYLLGRPEGYNRYGGVNARAFVEAKLTPAEIATKLEKDFSSVLREGEKVPEGKTIIGIGRRANPNVFTHELRHELSFSPNKPENEIKNRFYDLIYGSTSYPAYLTNIRRVHEATLHLDPEFKRGKTDADFARRRQMSWYSSDKEKEKHVLKSPYLQELLSPGKEGVSLPSRAKNLFSDIVNKNYELNVSGVNARTENLPKDAIELRSKFPFLNFVGSPEMENALPGPKAQPKSRAEGSPRTGETSADLYRSLLERSDLSRSIPTSPPSGPSKDSKTSADLLRSIPTSPSSGAPIKQPGWSDLESYDPQVLSAAAGRGITGALEGTSQMLGGARDYLSGFMQSVRERSPAELQGTAPARSKETYESVNRAVSQAARAAPRVVSQAAQDPLTTTMDLVSVVGDMGAEVLKSPASTTEFIADILTPIPGPSVRRGPPVLRMAEETGADAARTQQIVAQQFAGRLDDFVSKLKGPVRKDQFLGQLSNKFRSYEIDRANQALSDLSDNARLTPQELAGKLAATLSPTDLTTKIIPPGKKEFYRDFDNPYPERPLGIIHLNKQANISPEEMVRFEGLDQLKKIVGNLTRIRPLDETPDIGPDFKQNFLKAVRDSGADTPTTRSTVERLSEKVAEVANLHDEAKRYSKMLREYDTAFTVPAAVKTRLPGHDYAPYSKLVPTLRAVYDKAQRDRGERVTSMDNYLAANRLATKIVFTDSLNGFLRQVEPYIKQIDLPNNEPLYGRTGVKQAFDQLKDVQDLLKRNLDWVGDPDYIGSSASPDTQALTKLGEVIKADIGNGFGINSDDPLLKKINLLSDAVRTWRMGPYEQSVTETASTLRGLLKSAEERGPSLYKGQHPALEGGINPVAFSRFSEHTADIPGLGTGVRGIYVNELQSDLLQDVRKLGAQGRTAEMDQLELSRLAQEQNVLRSRIGLGITGGVVTDPEELQSLKKELGKNIKRQNILSSRLQKANPSSFSSGLGKNANMYQLPEPFAGMETSSGVLQQLLIKNVIGAAARRGDSFVAFPGVQSMQPQLYKNLPNNLKQVLKDLGPGFDVRMVTLPNKNGEPFTHPAVVWGPEAAARVTQKGIPFAQGGEVKALAKSY